MESDGGYDDAMITLLELVWGEGFMAPGGAGNIAKIVDGVDLQGKRVLDIGCGIGGPAFLLAGTYGANVLGTDLQPHLIKIANERAEKLGLAEQTDFRVVEPGPLSFPDDSFDCVVSSGAFTQIEDKLGMFKEVLRVLKSGGVFSCYDWMKSEGEYSDDMLYWFKIEGLTYAMETPERHEEILTEAGFVDAVTTDASKWYREQVRLEYEKVRGDLYPRMLELIGKEQSERFVEDWRAMMVVCEKREMRQVYTRSRKP